MTWCGSLCLVHREQDGEARRGLLPVVRKWTAEEGADSQRQRDKETARSFPGHLTQVPAACCLPTDLQDLDQLQLMLSSILLLHHRPWPRLVFNHRSSASSSYLLPRHKTPPWRHLQVSRPPSYSSRIEATLVPPT